MDNKQGAGTTHLLNDQAIAFGIHFDGATFLDLAIKQHQGHLIDQFMLELRLPRRQTPQIEKPEVPTSPIEPIGSAPRNDSGNYDMVQGSRNDSYLMVNSPLFASMWTVWPSLIWPSKSMRAIRSTNSC